jgi:hypothetical protein
VEFGFENRLNSGSTSGLRRFFGRIEERHADCDKEGVTSDFLAERIPAMLTPTQRRPRQVPVEKVVPAIRSPGATQAGAPLRDIALVLVLTRRVRLQILARQS